MYGVPLRGPKHPVSTLSSYLLLPELWGEMLLVLILLLPHQGQEENLHFIVYRNSNRVRNRDLTFGFSLILPKWHFMRGMLTIWTENCRLYLSILTSLRAQLAGEKRQPSKNQCAGKKKGLKRIPPIVLYLFFTSNWHHSHCLKQAKDLNFEAIFIYTFMLLCNVCILLLVINSSYKFVHSVWEIWSPYMSQHCNEKKSIMFVRKSI